MFKLKLFYLISSIQIKECFTYKINFFLWRFRNLISFLMFFGLWSAVFQQCYQMASYNKQQIFTYLFVANLVTNFVMRSRTDTIGADILSGKIINQLLKPINFFFFVAAKEFGDKFLNLVFTTFEILIICLILQPSFFIQVNLINYLLFAIAVVIAILLSFLTSFTLSLIAFWTTEIWAPRFVFMTFISLAAGSSFPLDILPSGLYKALMLTPFPYFVYLPVKLYLSEINLNLFLHLLIGVIWLVIMLFISKKIWSKGMLSFSFFCR